MTNKEVINKLYELEKMCPYLDEKGNPMNRQQYIAAVRIAKRALEEMDELFYRRKGKK